MTPECVSSKWRDRRCCI